MYQINKIYAKSKDEISYLQISVLQKKASYIVGEVEGQSPHRLPLWVQLVTGCDTFQFIVCRGLICADWGWFRDEVALYVEGISCWYALLS